MATALGVFSDFYDKYLRLIYGMDKGDLPFEAAKAEILPAFAPFL